MSETPRELYSTVMRSGGTASGGVFDLRRSRKLHQVQAHGLRGDTSIEDRARFDNYYIENWSLWLDTKIVIKTISQVLRRQGG